MLGHSVGTLRLYELLHKVEKHLGGLGHAPPEISQPPRLVLKPYRSAVYMYITAQMSYKCRTTLRMRNAT